MKKKKKYEAKKEKETEVKFACAWHVHFGDRKDLLLLNL